MYQNDVETLNALAERERERALIVESIINGLRYDEATTEPLSALEDRVRDLGFLVESDATIQGIIQGHLSDQSELAGEYDRCEALFSKYLK